MGSGTATATQDAGRRIGMGWGQGRGRRRETRDGEGDGEWDEDEDADADIREYEPLKLPPTSTLDGGGRFSRDRKQSQTVLTRRGHDGKSMTARDEEVPKCVSR